MSTKAERTADIEFLENEFQEASGIFIGNFAQQIINHSKIPVMSIRPDEGDPDKISLGY